jgi:endonuclease/exonuclease/phosphatase family metal-dependent hydrolase
MVEAIMKTLISACVLLFFWASSPSAREISVATWNLGWHMDIESAKAWIAECNKTYIEDATTPNKWIPSTAPEAQQAWDIDVFKIDGWDTARFPVCNVYFAGDAVRVTEASYRKRQQDIRSFILQSVPADIIAFQEVSGEQAVKEILPDAGRDYELCGFTSPERYKVQRLVVAWKRSLGTRVSCVTEDALHLPNNPVKDQPRPGLSLALKIDGVTLRVLTVHLKSSCVSPFQKSGILTGGGDACPILQQQIDPLEQWVEKESGNGSKVILLGDFNRNLWHELRDQALVRTDGSSPAGPRAAGSLSRSILKEVVDGVPLESSLTMLNEECPIGEIGKLLCLQSEIRPLTSGERDLLGSREYLGCRNPVTLDHILVGQGVKSENGASHVSIGGLGGTRKGINGGEATLAISDHCPMMARVQF